MLPRDLVRAAMVVLVAAQPGLFYGRRVSRHAMRALREQVGT
jgi:hypothetical protein